MGISMTNSITILLVLVFLTASCIIFAKPAISSTDVVEDFWVSKAPMHEARAGLGVAVVNAKIYAIGGSTTSGGEPGGKIYQVSPNDTQFVSTNEEYDPATDMWTFKKPMPTSRCSFGIAVCQNKIYVIGGETSSGRIGVNEVYDPATDAWENRASMSTADWALSANVVNGKIYVIGSLGANQVYDPATDSWATKAPTPYPGGGMGYASAVVDNKIYAIGAWSGPDSPNNLNQIYDPETDSWSFGAPAPSNVFYATAGATTSMNAPERVYVFCTTLLLGGGGAPPFANYVYDPANDSWTVGASIPTPRINAGVAVINDTLYVVGGDTYGALGIISPSAVNEKYMPIGYAGPAEPSPSPSQSPSPSSSSTATSPSTEPEPLTTALVAAAVVSVTVVVAGLLVYFKKRKR